MTEYSITGTQTIVRFGSFELDLRSGQLFDSGHRVPLQAQPLAILRMLLDHPGSVVTRQDLREQLWPGGTFDDVDHNLNAAMKRLRAALGDDAGNPRYIETLPQRGYRFIGAHKVPAHETDRPPVRAAVLPFIAPGDGEDDDSAEDEAVRLGTTWVSAQILGPFTEGSALGLIVNSMKGEGETLDDWIASK